VDNVLAALDGEALARHIETLVGPCPPVRDVELVLFSLTNVFIQLSEGPPSSPPPYTAYELPYGLANSVVFVAEPSNLT
jgi:hypothetical protein